MGTYSKLRQLSKSQSPTPKPKKATATRVREQEDKQTSKLVNKSTSKQVYVKEFLSKKALATVSFKVPPEITEKLRKVYLRANDRYGEVKIYEIVVAALALFFWDFDENGEQSELYQLLVKGKVNK